MYLTPLVEYCRKPLEKAFTLDELRSIGTQPKEGVCQYLWYMDGLKGWSTPGVPPKVSRKI